MKKGFTLIELLAVIVILAIIAVITVPVILSALGTSRDNAYNRQIDMVEKAAELYIADKVLNNIEVGEYIFLDSLVSSEQIKSLPIDPRTNTALNGVFKVTKVGDNYTYDFVEINNTSGEVVVLDTAKTVKTITIEGNSTQVTTTLGKNLFDPYFYIAQSTSHSNRYTAFDGGMRDSSLYSDGRAWTEVATYKLSPNTTYTFSALNPSGVRVELKADDSTIYISDTSKSLTKTFTTTSTGLIGIKVNPADPTMGPELQNIQIELGSNATSYEKFVPNRPSTYYRSDIKDVTGNLMVDGVAFASLPTLRKALTTKDTYDVISGNFVKSVNISAITSNATWNDWNSTTRRVVNFGAPSRVTGNNSLGLFSAGTVINNGMGPNNSSTLGVYSLNNASYWYPSYYEMGISTSETMANANTKLQTWLTNNPVYYSYILQTPITTNLGTKTLPNGSKYLYLDSEVKGNIIVEYN